MSGCTRTARHTVQARLVGTYRGVAVRMTVGGVVESGRINTPWQSTTLRLRSGTRVTITATTSDLVGTPGLTCEIVSDGVVVSSDTAKGFGPTAKCEAKI